MKPLLLLLIIFLFHPLASTTKKDTIKKSTTTLPKNGTKEKIDKWFETYSCSELEISELKLIAYELEKIIKEFDGNPDHLETLIAQYCHEVAEKHLHSECFLAVVKACEEAILRKYNKPSTFQEILFAYSQKINDAVSKRIIKKQYKVS